MRTRRIRLAELVDDEQNARTHDDRNLAAIASSLERFGQVEPIIVQAGTRRIIAGHGRKAALEALGRREADVLELDLDDLDARELGLRLNRSGELAGWDQSALAVALKELELDGRDLNAIGFDSAEIDRAFSELEDDLGPIEEEGGNGELEDPEDEDLEALPEVPQARAKAGDVFELGGRHRVACLDSLEDGRLLELVGEAAAAALVTDPPYAIYGSSTGISSDVADGKMVRPFFETLARVSRKVLRPFAHAYTFCDWRSWAAILESFDRGGLTAKNLLVWDKGGSACLGSSYGHAYELVGFFANLPRKDSLWDKSSGQRTVHRPNILRYGKVPRGEKEHAAAKPVELLAELLENSTDEGELVLDPFAGSGSVLIAAERKGRRCVSVDVEPKWVDVAVARWERLTGETAKLLEG